jgi:hypothetical protein
MLPKRTLLTSVAVASVTVALAAGASQATGKPDTKSLPTTKSSVATDVAAAKDGLIKTPALNPAVAKASEQIQTRIVKYVAAHGTGKSFATYADAKSGKVIVETNASADVVKGLVGTDAELALVRTTATADLYSRKSDVPAFWGGNGITLAGTAPSARCSGGYVVKNSAGTRYLVTAGHCFSNGQVAVTENTGVTVGTTWGNGLPSQDMEILYGQSYGTSIYTGGVDSSTGAHVASAADPVVGFNNYCHSGRTTGENCGHTVISTNATVCTSSGCKSPVTAFQGGNLPQPGDSGSPFYALSTSGPDRHIRGHIIAGNGTTEYAEKWSRVAARFGVTIAN